MTKKDFFTVLIKLFGLYSLILSVFYYLPQNLSILTFEPTGINLLIVIGVVAITVAFFVFLLVKTHIIVSVLKLDKGFDNDLMDLGNLSETSIIKLALILIGGFLIIDHAPYLLQNLFLAFKDKAAASNVLVVNYGTTTDYFNTAIAGMNVIIGVLFLTNYYALATWLTSKIKN